MSKTNTATTATTNKTPKVRQTKEIPAEHTTTSAKIRYLHKEGMSTADIAAQLGIIYQHARNVLKQPLKKAVAQ